MWQHYLLITCNSLQFLNLIITLLCYTQTLKIFFHQTSSLLLILDYLNFTKCSPSCDFDQHPNTSVHVLHAYYNKCGDLVSVYLYHMTFSFHIWPLNSSIVYNCSKKIFADVCINHPSTTEELPVEFRYWINIPLQWIWRVLCPSLIS